MADYEALYYEYKSKYEKAVSDRNTVRNLSSDRWRIKQELNAVRDDYVNLQNKIERMDLAINSCKKYLDDTLPIYSSLTAKIWEEYDKSFKSDFSDMKIGVAYETSFSKMNNNILDAKSILEAKENEMNDELTVLQSQVEQKTGELRNINRKLNSYYDESYYTNRVNSYYALMQDAKRKWAYEG